MSSMFAPVTKRKTRLRMAIDGPSGAGKTYTALRFAFALAGERGRAAVIDTEHETAAKYAGEAPDGIPWRWDGCDLEHFSPSTYAQVIQAAGDAGYDVLVIDSLSHAWIGSGGALDQVDQKARHAKGSNSFTAWRDVTPQHRDMVDAILRSPCHVIATLRTKMEYALEQNDKGKTTVRKVGTKPLQREGVEYEFDVIVDMDLEHTLAVSKSRCSAVDGKVVHKPTGTFIEPLRRWLQDGAEAPASRAAEPSTRAQRPRGIVLGRPEGRADDAQAIRIRGLCRDLGWSPDRLREVLAKVGARRIADLEASQAEALIARLSTRLLEREGKEAF